MTPFAEEPPVVNDTAAHQFRIELGGVKAFLDYRRSPGTIVFVHTEVPEELRGRGLADGLAKAGLEFARAEHLTVVAQCPFVAAYIRRHPEYASLTRRPKASS